MVRGVLEAPNEDLAMRQIDRLGLIPIDVRAVADAVAAKSKDRAKAAADMGQGKKVPLVDIIIMTRQLLTLLRAGVPILNCLEALISQTTNPNLKGVLQGVQKEVEAGSLLSASFAKFPKTFSPLFIHTVRAGEVGGVLPEVLLRLSDMMEHDLETVRAVKAAVRYPIMVVIALSVAFLVLITFVVPRFAALYARFSTQLPLPTRILIAANQVIVHWWYVALPALALIVFMIVMIIKTERGRFLWDTMWLKTPVFGPLILKVSMGRFAEMFSTLYKSGVPVLRVIEIVSQTLGNTAVGKEVAAMALSVKQGQGLAEPLKKSRFFPPMVVQMLSVGEKSGSVDDMLNEVAKHYDMETKYIVRNLTSMIEPMLLVGLGLIVLLLALGIFLPMWDMIKLYRH